jgi:hypothetical protein
MKLPVKLISRARRTPMAWGSSTVSPQPGITPTRVWVSPNLARSDATRKSQLSASSKPPVTATPLIAPITGLVRRGNGPRTPSRLRLPSAPVPPPRLEPSEPSSFRSSPAENAGSAPVRISTSTPSSASACRIRSGSSASTSVERALRASGRLSVIVAIRSDTSYSTTSSAIHPSSRAGVGVGQSSVSGGRNARGRSPSLTSVDAIQPPSAPKCSSSSVLVPSATVSSASSYRPS